MVYINVEERQKIPKTYPYPLVYKLLLKDDSFSIRPLLIASSTSSIIGPFNIFFSSFIDASFAQIKNFNHGDSDLFIVVMDLLPKRLANLN